MIDYFLFEEASDITLEIIKYSQNPVEARSGRSILRKYSSKDTLYKIGDVNIPHYWIRPQQMLSTEEGHHRFMWDMKLNPLNLPPSYPIGANYMNTAPDQTAPWVMPGNYTARLTIDGKVHEQSITIKIDPRVKTLPKDLQLQYDLSVQCYNARKECMNILNEIKAYRAKFTGDQNTPTYKEINSLETTIPGTNEPSFSRLNSSFASLFSSLQDSDTPPTTQIINAAKELNQQFTLLKKKWEELKKK
jgi:hypothetical protein